MHAGPTVKVVTSLRNDSSRFSEHSRQQGLMQPQRLLFLARHPLANKAIDFAAVASSAVASLAGAFFLSDGTGGLVANDHVDLRCTRLQHRLHGQNPPP
jgi:hypothetical protein